MKTDSEIGYILTLLVLIALILVTHTLFFVGYTVSDDWLYLSQAKRYLSGELGLPQTHWGFRYTIVLPLVLIGLVADYTEPLLALFPLLYWIATFALTVWFLQRSAGRHQALIGGLLVATLPLFVVQSSIIGVDIAEAFFLFASFAVFYLAETAENPRYRSYLIAGVSLGLALLTRETAYGFLIVLGLFFLLGGFRRWKLYLAGLAGVLAILSMEWTYYLLFDQGPLYRLFTISESHGTIGIKTGDFHAGSGNLSDNRLFGPVIAVLLNQEFAFLFWAAIGSTIYLYSVGNPEHRRVMRHALIAFGAYFIWIGYAGAVRPLPRYFSFPALLAVIPIALALARISQRWVRVAALLILVGGSFAALSVENIHPRFASRTVSEFATESHLTVVTDERSSWQAKAFLDLVGYSGDKVSDKVPDSGTFVYAAVEGLDPPEELMGALTRGTLVAEKAPPKLLIGQIMDLVGLAYFVPPKLYRYLAVRNPTVRFYRLNLPGA